MDHRTDMTIEVETDSDDTQSAKVFDLEEITNAIHGNFKEIKELYTSTNEEIFNLSGTNFENKHSEVVKDEDSLYGNFKKIRRKLIQINKLMKNYIDNYVVTEKISTDFVRYMAEKNQQKAEQDDFSLSEILDFLGETSGTRDIQKHEQDLFVMCGMINSFLLDKQFALKEDNVASGYYEGTQGESLEETSKISIGLSNFVANFGKILRKRTVKGKKDSEIKRVMDTEPARVDDTDFDLYKIPFKKNGEVSGTEESNSALLDSSNPQLGKANDHSKSEPSTHNETVISSIGESSISKNLDNEIQQLAEKEENDFHKIEDDSAESHLVKLVNGSEDISEHSNDSTSSDQDESMEMIQTKSQLAEAHEEKLEKNKEFFDNLEADRLKVEKSQSSNLEASPVSLSSDVESKTPKSQTSQTGKTGDSGSVEDDKTEDEGILDVKRDVGNLVEDVEETILDKDDDQVEKTSHEDTSDLDSLLKSPSNDDISSSTEDSLHSKSDTQDLESALELDSQPSSTNKNEEGTNTSSHDSESSKSEPQNLKVRKLKKKKLKENKEGNLINPRQKISEFGKTKVKLEKKKKAEKDRKLGLAQFLKKKHRRHNKNWNQNFFTKKTFLPKKELMFEKIKTAKKKSFIPIKFGYSDIGYINRNILNSNNSNYFEHNFENKRKKIMTQKVQKNSFSVYGKKKWYKPKIKIYNREPEIPDNMYRANPMINLI